LIGQEIGVGRWKKGMRSYIMMMVGGNKVELRARGKDAW
jgi:hypothetical protein